MRFILVFFFGFFYCSTVSQQIIEDDFECSGTISAWFGDDCGVDGSFANPYAQ